MSERIFQGVDVDGNLEQGEIGIIRDRIVIRRHPVIVKKFLIQEIFIQGGLDPAGEFPFAFQPGGNDFLLKRAHLQVDHGAFALQGIVSVPFPNAFLIRVRLGQSILFFRQVA